MTKKEIIKGKKKVSYYIGLNYLSKEITIPVIGKYISPSNLSIRTDRIVTKSIKDFNPEKYNTIFLDGKELTKGIDY